ncbi:MAG: hypothetical protein FWH08_02810 [Oscillospiraceae bacterium]|nr:hypothetical protein [Oscillospiraceae bacterium]
MSLAKNELEGFIVSGRIPHAFCYVGDNSANSEEFSEYAARLILCERGGVKPCDTAADGSPCKSCKKLQSKTHPDIVRVREAMPDGKYKVDALRKIVADSVFRPNDGDLRVYIFEQADTMSAVCQNALLKFTEEPPEYVKIIFTAKSADLFLDTIKSRLVFINAETSENSEISEISEKNKELLSIARDFMNAVSAGNEYMAAAALSGVKTREDLSGVLGIIAGEIRNCMINTGNSSYNMSIGDFARAQKFLQSCIEDLKYNPNVALACTHVTAGIYKEICKT